MLNRMLQQVVDQEGRKWENPRCIHRLHPGRASLWKETPRTLDVAKEAWKEQLSLFCSVIEYVQSMQDQIDRVAPIEKQHMKETQAEQKWIYSRQVQSQPGDWVLLLLPRANCKFLAHWQGPARTRFSNGWAQ